MGTAIICVIIIALCVIGVVSTQRRVSNGCCGSGGDTVKKVKAKDTDISHYPYTYVIEVKGMTCSNCQHRVENAFNEQDGFYAIVNLKKGLATIHMKEPISEFDVKQIIIRTGYETGNIVK